MFWNRSEVGGSPTTHKFPLRRAKNLLCQKQSHYKFFQTNLHRKLEKKYIILYNTTQNNYFSRREFWYKAIELQRQKHFIPEIISLRIQYRTFLFRILSYWGTEVHKYNSFTAVCKKGKTKMATNFLFNVPCGPLNQSSLPGQPLSLWSFC